MVRLGALLLLVLLISGCSDGNGVLPQTSDSDPVWQLNEGKWTFNENALTQPPAVVPSQRADR